MNWKVAVLAGGLLAAAGPALATDFSNMVYSPHPISGYVELRGGVESGSGSNSWDGPWTENGGVFGGAGRVAVGLSPNLTVQADAWTNVFSGTSDVYGSYSDSYSGIAGHLSWRTMEGHLIGVFVSAGAEGYGAFGTIGVEGVHNYGNWRFYGQAGVSGGFGGQAADESARDWYARGVVSYFFNPNLVLSGNLGIDQATDTSFGGTTIDGSTWGARLEYKPETMPVSVFAAYQGWHWSGSDHDPSTWDGTEHALVAGVRILYDSNGQTNLRQMANSVGLSDMNHAYGEDFVP
jgi:hypothetical protein